MLEADIAGGIYGKQKQHHRADERIFKVIDPAGADISAFEHVRYCPAARKL